MNIIINGVGYETTNQDKVNLLDGLERVETQKSSYGMHFGQNAKRMRATRTITFRFMSNDKTTVLGKDQRERLKDCLLRDKDFEIGISAATSELGWLKPRKI